MTAAVSAGRGVQPFRSPNEQARSLPQHRSYDEDHEEGLVTERPLRHSQRGDRNANVENMTSNHSRKRPRSLPPQGSLRQSQYQQQREPKSEPWPSHQRPKLRTEDSSQSHSPRGRDNNSKQSPPSSQLPPRQYNNSNIKGHSDRDSMCNTPFRRNGATTYRTRNSNHFYASKDSNSGQFNFKQGTNAPRQQHRCQERNEADYLANYNGEYRASDSGEYNRNLPARREDEKREPIGRRPEVRRDWGGRRPEGGRGWNERRPGNRIQYNETRPGDRRDWNERRPAIDTDRNRPNQNHCRQAQLRTPYHDSRDHGQQNCRDRNEQASRPSGPYNNSYPQRTRVPQERNNQDYQTESPHRQEDHYRNERSRDQGFHPRQSNIGGESHSNSHLHFWPPMNEGPSPARSENRYIEPNDRPCNGGLNRHPRPLPASSSPPSREYNRTTPWNDRQGDHHDENASFDRYQSRDEYRDNVSRAGYAMDINQQSGRNRSQFVGSNSQSQITHLQQPSLQDDRRYQYSSNTEPRFSREKQAQTLQNRSLGYDQRTTNTKVMEERPVAPKTAFESKALNKTEVGIRSTTGPKTVDGTPSKSLSPSSTCKTTTAAAKPVTESKKIEAATKSMLAIPMRWLKPKVKSKKPVQKSVTKEQSIMEQKKQVEKVDAVKIPRVSKAAKVGKGNGSMSSPFHRSPSANRMVTDSEGGSTLSNMKEIVGESIERSRSKPTVPRAIVTKLPLSSKIETTDDDTLKSDNDSSVDDEKSDPKPPSVLRTSASSSTASVKSCASDDSDSDTDDEEVMMWASKMFGVPFRASDASPGDLNGGEEEPSPTKKLRLKLKLPRPEPQADEVIKAVDRPKKKKKTTKTKRKRTTDKDSDNGEVVLPLKKRKGKPKKRTSIGTASDTYEVTEEQRRRKESAKPLTEEQISSILGEDDFAAPGGSNWVRRSVRQPSKDLLSAKPLRILIEMLKHSDPGMVVLKMKKYINDPNAPSVVLDAALDALEENTNCQTLYIQNFNEGMRDKQVLHLLRILQHPKCKIWCLNIGENYNVKTRTWNKFTKGLKKTKITHMYASEHTITTEMKDDIRATIRNNRKKHDMHINPNNLHVIVQCTHCWWNPINAKALRPYLKNEGFEHILADKETQGLRGSSSTAPSI